MSSSSEDSDDEPLSNKAKTKVSEEMQSTSENQTFTTAGLLNQTYEAMELSPIKNFNPPLVIERPDAWLYLKHLSAVGPYTCLLCTEIFINRIKMALHYMLNHKKDYCGICRYFVPDRRAWILHENFHDWICSQCTDSFDNEKQLRVHLSKAHNMVHCRLCHFMTTDDDNYKKHLTKKHSVTNFLWKDSDYIWETSENSEHFKCLLCNRHDITKVNFCKHFLTTTHRMTMKCVSTFLSGYDVPIPIHGAEVSSHFADGALTNQVTMGYVPLGSATQEASTNMEEDVLVDSLIPEVKLEKVSEEDHETFTVTVERLKNEDDGAFTDNPITDNGIQKMGHGDDYFDITFVELIAIQKCLFDYIEYINREDKDELLKIRTEIDYSSVNSKFLDIQCQICYEKYVSIYDYSLHLQKAHGIRHVPFYSCRTCGTNYNSQKGLDGHSREKKIMFKNLNMCQFCDEEFDARDSMRQHLLEHIDRITVDNCFSPNYGFKCKLCPKLFWNEIERDRHQREVHIDEFMQNGYKCSICSERFCENLFFAHHILQQHSQEIDVKHPFMYKCCICCEVLWNIKEMESHFSAYHPLARKKFCCLGDCNLKPLGKGAFKIHLQKSHEFQADGIVPISCPQCGIEFPSQKLCNAHITQHHKQGRFKCRLCSERLHSADERKLHCILRHPGCHQFKCKHCNKTFLHKSALYNHNFEHRAIKESYTCSECGKVFNRRDSFAEHLLIHSGPRHACSYCPRMFVQRSNMLRHERRHTGERPYTCAHCDRTFADKGACNLHMRTHFDQKYTCADCGQGFSQKIKLIYHVRKHTGMNLEKCEVCSKIFTSKYSLREHQKGHGTDLRHHCPLCPRSYNRVPALQRHIKVSHKLRDILNCPLCDKKFTNVPGLKDHVLTHSKVNMFRCKICPKSYNTRRQVAKHIRENHASRIKGKQSSSSIMDFYLRLDVRKIGLDLDEGMMTKIFGPLPSPADSNRVLPAQKTVFPDHLKNIPDCKNMLPTAVVSIKCERYSDSEMEDSRDGERNGRIAEVDVKCEPLSDSELVPSDTEIVPSDSEIVASDSETVPSDSEIVPTDFVAVKQEFSDGEDEG